MAKKNHSLLTCWRESVSILLPAHGKLFGLVTLNAIRQAVLVNFFTYYIVFQILLVVFLVYQGIQRSITNTILAGLVYAVLWVLCTRSAVQPHTKGLDNKITSAFGFLIFLCIYGYLFSALYVPLVVVLCLLLFFTIQMVWLFDADPYRSFLSQIYTSLKNALYTVLYNLPILCILVGISYGVLCLISLIPGVSYALAISLFMILVIPILVITLTNIYIKHVHEQSQIYFPQPEQ